MARVFHRLRPFVALVSSLLLSLLALQASGSPGEITYQSSVSEVRLTFFATDEKNRGVETLQSGDFAVVDNGQVIRQFRSFSRSNLTRLNLVVVVDVSESVISRYRQEIAEVLQLMAHDPAVPDDHIAVIAFGGMQSAVVCSGDCRNSPAVERLVRTKADGATPLYDALLLAGNFVVQHRDAETRPVMILFSDGEDTISKISAANALAAALESEAPIYAVDLNPPGRPSDGASTLESLTEATGGRHLYMERGAAEILSALLTDLHSGYLVTYKLPNRARGFHALRILPTHNMNWRFRCRSGYVYPSDVR
jgi:VWFA-related protein